MTQNNEQPTEQVTVRMPAELVAALERIARENDRTISAEIRRTLRRHVAEQEAVPSVHFVELG